ncbi:GNAT family N-acetyltransferase [Oceanobacillus sp. J11TS1]|uniref:GNAT family N-acetyltransferase n=1 Tax=Oceanobacillus sp. J11TS1 TaxID=2807191 RepID=UPI001AFFFF29|nr:GNAT family protein [Oceanobacillus sp. J11TS1]GIO23937.1 ribosomal-protein-serine acetyltransferase [Oceanobacillus sp. J11TS1]
MFHYTIDDNLSLRQLQLTDANALFKVVENSREKLRTWLPWIEMTRQPTDCLAFIDMCLQSAQRKQSLHVGIFKGNNIIGCISYNYIDWQNGSTSIGYWLDPTYQGKGVMTAAVQVMIDYAFYTLRLNRIEIRATTHNKKSRAIPERFNFQKEGIIRQGEWLYDHFEDLVVYGLLASEWKH